MKRLTPTLHVVLTRFSDRERTGSQQIVQFSYFDVSCIKSSYYAHKIYIQHKRPFVSLYKIKALPPVIH